MCAIAGILGFRDDSLLEDFSRLLAHRGPDGEGFFKSGEVSLLNRRLAIIDLKTGDQPVYNEDRSVVTVYNGEIYNYRELRESLIKTGHRFTTASDTEVIVHSYEEWGTKSFDKFNGMFAIALYDKKKKKLILARDHFGIKPLYYSVVSSDKSRFRLMFSSEIKPIIESGLIEKKPNERVLYRYLKYRVHDDTNETFFKHVFKLMPGQMMICDDKGLELSNFSTLKQDLRAQKTKGLTEEAIDTFKKELKDAVRLRLISDVQIGTCLSGGLDSSTIVGMVNTLLQEHVKETESVGKNQNTFSAVFPKQSNNEERYVDELGEKYKTLKMHKVYPQPEEFFEEIEDFVRTQEEPTISSGPYAQYKVMQYAKDYVKVLLDGQGSDEMMAGYLPYYFVYLRQLKKQKKYAVLAGEIAASLDVIIKYFFVKKGVRPDQVLHNDFTQKHKREEFKIVKDNLKERLLEDIFHNSLPSLLRYEDKNSMRFSIEGRVPFLDTNLLSLIFKLSDEAIIKNGWNKYILRQAVKNLLPDIIVKRRNKIGFTTPEQEWFIRMKNKIYGVFLSESFANRPYFNQSEALKLFQEFIEGKNDDTLLFWRLLNTELWLRIFFDKEKKPIVQKTKIKTEITVKDKRYLRFPLRTRLFNKGDDVPKEVSPYLVEFLREHKQIKKWLVVVSEKIVAIAQGRSYFLWEIHPGFWAKFLSKYVTKTPYGIGLGSPWTMQLAIQEAGLFRILLATVLAAVTKPFGVKGLFYKLAGNDINAIDGPTEYSLYPSNVSAKLGPKDPQQAAQNIKEAIAAKLPKNQKDLFLGAAIIDANDLGQNVLGNATSLNNSEIEQIFRDNPMGQGREQTPICVVLEEEKSLY